MDAGTVLLIAPAVLACLAPLALLASGARGRRLAARLWERRGGAADTLEHRRGDCTGWWWLRFGAIGRPPWIACLRCGATAPATDDLVEAASRANDAGAWLLRLEHQGRAALGPEHAA